MNKTVVAYCDGGLGNRLNSLIGAVWFARQLELPLAVSWPINRWCAAPLEDLFDAPWPADRRTLPELQAQHRRHVLVAPKRQAFAMPLAFDPQVLRPRGLLAQVRSALVQSEGVLYSNPLVPGYILRGQAEGLARMLRIKLQYREAADEYLAAVGLQYKAYWGVHLRGTDAGFGPEYYDFWWRVLQVLPGPKVLCTDDRALEDRFLRNPSVMRRTATALPRKAAPGLGWNEAQVDEYGREFNYNIYREADAVREAMIDFEILSRSCVLPTSGSTFLENARRFSARATRLSWLHDATAWLRYAYVVARTR